MAFIVFLEDHPGLCDELKQIYVAAFEITSSFAHLSPA